MREATLFRIYGSAIADISIPASHAGGDIVEHYAAFRIGISIPASHAGGDYLLPYLYCILYKFQSPPPMREATISAALEALIDVISIPASHAGGDRDAALGLSGAAISIPASHAGGDDVELQVVFASLKRFQSPPPMREATQTQLASNLPLIISIPASHAGGD